MKGGANRKAEVETVRSLEISIIENAQKGYFTPRNKRRVDQLQPCQYCSASHTFGVRNSAVVFSCDPEIDHIQLCRAEF